MDSKYDFKQSENDIYAFWEKNDFFTVQGDKTKKPFCIILPPPNANANLHLGHAMYVFEDVMVRYQKIMGHDVLWLAGADHAGIETQFVYEKELKKQGKSRFDFDRETLYQNIWNFVMKNKNTMEHQLRRLGFALDWKNKKFTLDTDIVRVVYTTFKKLYDEGLIYRANKLVNYCTSCGTSFSDLEVVYKEMNDPLYYMKYGPFVLATVRPETKFGDTAVAVNPKDNRYKKWIGKTIEVEGLIGKFEVNVIADESVDPKFGTGVVKITPAHDFNDYEVARRHHLPLKQVIGFDGKLNELTGKYKGLRIYSARKQVVQDLTELGMIEKVDTLYTHRVGTCYRCQRVLEPLPKEQWFINVEPLKQKAIELVKSNKICIYPKKFKKQLIEILDNFIDWNVSRQIVWGIRIPAYKCTNPDLPISKSKNDRWFVSETKPKKCEICGECEFIQDEDTFDTWFSSAQWPFATLQTISKDIYDKFYPTTVMETGYDILRAWVSRMIMIGYFATNDVPFKNVFLHGMVRDRKGQKMSKSKGNVINPLDMIDKYGTDALRSALIFGTKEGGDVVLSEDKIVAMRNFCNKVWNIGRFLYIQKCNKQVKENSGVKKIVLSDKDIKKIILEIKKQVNKVQKKYHSHFSKYEFAKAFNLLYDFVWHKYADEYIEQLKDSMQAGNINVTDLMMKIYLSCLQMLHPYIPFVTETVWKEFDKKPNSSIISSNFFQ